MLRSQKYPRWRKISDCQVNSQNLIGPNPYYGHENDGKIPIGFRFISKINYKIYNRHKIFIYNFWNRNNTTISSIYSICNKICYRFFYKLFYSFHNLWINKYKFIHKICLFNSTNTIYNSAQTLCYTSLALHTP